MRELCAAKHVQDLIYVNLDNLFLLAPGPHASPWDLLGEFSSEVLDLPSLHSMIRKDVLGPMEILLALAGQMGRVSGDRKEG